MGEYRFDVLDVHAEPYAAAPQLTAQLRVEELTGQRVHAMALRCQVRIEPQRRGYDDGEAAGLTGLFGRRERWRDTLRPFQWMQTSATVQGFDGSCTVDLPLPCTYDFDVTGSRYLHSLGTGTVPLQLLFSGTVFTRGQTGFGVEPVPWDREARYDLPVEVWQETMRAFYPGTGWLRMDQENIDRLAAYRAEHGLTSWDETVQRLLTRAAEVAR